MQRPEIPSLTGLRFYAAAFVLWAHTVGGFFIPAKVPVLENAATIGHLGMTLFFVLSGFVIYYNYGASVSTLTARALYTFALARFARLYPLFFLCVAISMAMSREPSPAVAETWLFYLTMTHDWFPRVVNNIMLGDLFAPASWSISAEVFLYSIFLALARPVDRLLRSERMIAYVIAAFVVLVSSFYLGRLAGLWYAADEYWLFYRSPFCRISEFTLGVLVAALYNARSASIEPAQKSRLPAFLAGCGLVWTTLLLVAGALPSLQTQALMLQHSWGFAPAVAALIYYLARYRSPLSWWVENKAALLLGEASYSIYLLHWVFLWVFMSSGVSANVLLVPKVVLAWLMTGLLALGCYRYFEWPMRVFIRRALAMRRQPDLIVATAPQSLGSGSVTLVADRRGMAADVALASCGQFQTGSLSRRNAVLRYLAQSNRFFSRLAVIALRQVRAAISMASKRLRGLDREPCASADFSGTIDHRVEAVREISSVLRHGRPR